jgi:hypothetical protein
MMDGLATPIAAHSWKRETHEHYVEPRWCSARLFEEEMFPGLIFDPCCGFGRIPDSAKAAGYSAIATDLVDRGYVDMFGTCDFMTAKRIIPQVHSIVCNPPFDIAPAFALRALETDARKIAMVFPTARLNAAHWLQGTPLKRVWLMTPRPSMPPGHVIAAGEKPGGGKVDFCWLIWERGHEGPPELLWLRRDH